MEYIISFLEGMITFISPCLLPITYFADSEGYLVAHAKSMMTADMMDQGIGMIYTE